MSVLMIDNRDSFTFNLVEAFARLGEHVTVLRNSVNADAALARAEAEAALIVLSPGPGRPEDAGCCIELIGKAKNRIAVLGVCLGHQAIVQEAGAMVAGAPAIVHGKASVIDHDGAGPFEGLPNPLRVGRYHSLCTPNPPARFRVHGAIDGMAMAISDPEARQYGVQFHPESILTPHGDDLLRNIVRLTVVH